MNRLNEEINNMKSMMGLEVSNEDKDPNIKGISTKNLSKDRGIMAGLLREDMNKAGITDTQILDYVMDRQLRGSEAYNVMVYAFEDLVHKKPDLRSIESYYINQLDRYKNSQT